MAAQRHPFPSDGGAGAARVGAGGSFGHVRTLRARPKASLAYASNTVRARGGEAAEDMSSRWRTNLFVGGVVALSGVRRWVPAFAGTTVGRRARRDDGWPGDLQGTKKRRRPRGRLKHFNMQGSL